MLTYVPAVIAVVFIAAVLPLKPTPPKRDRYCR